MNRPPPPQKKDKTGLKPGWRTQGPHDIFKYTLFLQTVAEYSRKREKGSILVCKTV